MHKFLSKGDICLLQFDLFRASCIIIIIIGSFLITHITLSIDVCSAVAYPEGYKGTPHPTQQSVCSNSSHSIQLWNNLMWNI